MKYYRAIIETNGEWPPEETNAAMLRMELIFTVGDKHRGGTAEAIMENTLADLHLSRYMAISSVQEISENVANGSLSGLTVEEPCDICHKFHNAKDIVKIGDVMLIPGHEYILETKTNRQKYPHRWRMGFMGKGMTGPYLQFSARGPGRSHSNQYGGTVTMSIADIKFAVEVERDDAKRHVGQQVRIGGLVNDPKDPN